MEFLLAKVPTIAFRTNKIGIELFLAVRHISKQIIDDYAGCPPTV